MMCRIRNSSRIPEVEAALQALKGHDSWGNRVQGDDDIDALKTEIEILKAERDQLARKVKDLEHRIKSP